MITTDQPKIFQGEIIAAVSSLSDGNIKKANMPSEVTVNVDRDREILLKSMDISLDQTVLVKISYDRDDYTRYRTASSDDQGKGILPGTDIEVYDALMTAQPGIALFLPLADCVGAILYDPTKKILMVSHLGRHNIEQQGALRSVQYMKDNAGVDPSNLKVWLSPSAGKENYPLFAFDNKSQQDVVLEQLKIAGVTKENIEAANIDTTTSEDYFSHSQYLKDSSRPNGRFAIVAMLK